jgi:hypothetical protein
MLLLQQQMLYDAQQMSDPLVALFGGTTKIRVLDALLADPDKSFHLRGLAQAAGTDSGNTSNVLKLLVQSGWVTAAADSHSTRYSINVKSPLVAPLRQLLALAGALIKDLRAAADKVDADYVGVYGSVAAATDDAASDVDVLVVGKLSAVAAQTAFKPVGRKHHKTVNVVAVRVSQLKRQLNEGGAFWDSIANGKRIDLKGSWQDVTHGQATAS